MSTIISKPKLSFIALFLILATKLVHSQDDVTSFTFETFAEVSENLTYRGGAHVPSGSTFLRLTQTDSSGVPVSWKSGRVLYARPVKFWEGSRQATFETTIRFVIKPGSKGAADGITFFIAPVNTVFDENPTGGNLGVFNHSTGTMPSLFAIEFDTFTNSYDPSYRHIGVDIESRASKKTTQFDSATGQVVTAHIEYDGDDHKIRVFATYGSQSASVHYSYNLKAILPQQVQVGISSSTGSPASNLGVHDIHSWYFASSLVNTNHHDTFIRQYV